MLIRHGGRGWESPSITHYSDEAALETLLLETPDLLPTDGDAPLILVRQVPVPGAGQLDLLAVGLDGSVTVIECKLRANPEIRRSVVGQVLAYASGLWRLSYDEFDAAVARAGHAPLVTLASTRAAELGLDLDEEEFRRRLTDGIAAGRMRLVIAIDEITEELKRIVEFLNDRSAPDLEVLALELGYVAHGGVEIILPTVYGQESVRRKASRPTWGEREMLQELDQSGASDVLGPIYRRAQQHPLLARFSWGKGGTPSVSAYFHVRGRETSVWTIYANPEGAALALNFQTMWRQGVPSDRLEALAVELAGLPDVARILEGLAEGSYARRPILQMSALESPGTVDLILAALERLLLAD